jgi:hypothetical protein
MFGSVTGSVVRGESLMPERDFALKFTPVAHSTNLSVSHRSACTDETGRFALDGLRPGVWLVAYKDLRGGWRQFYAHVLADATMALEIDVSAAGEEGTSGCNGAAGPPPVGGGPAGRGGVRGEVVDPAGRPVSDAAITVLRASGNFPDIAPLTDAEGRFALDDLPAGEWVFQALAPDGRIGEAAVNIPPGQLAVLTIRLGVA